MAFWWVNHKLTGRHEVAGDYLWSPKANRNNSRNQYYVNMTLAKPGDVVFSFIGSRIGAIGVVSDFASTAPKPKEFLGAGDYWSDEGWYLPVSFKKTLPLSPRDYLGLIVPLLPKKYSPIQSNGHGNVVYLSSISDSLGAVLVGLLGESIATEIADETQPASWTEPLDPVEPYISPDVPETQRVQLVKARVGQGIFRSSTLLMHPVCRVTGVSEKRLLRASHIKPWRVSDNHERLDGANGIMLSPHIDALFDLGLMSFTNDGRTVVRSDLSWEVLSRWSVPKTHDPKPFDSRQHSYLAGHRLRLEQVGLVDY